MVLLLLCVFVLVYLVVSELVSAWSVIGSCNNASTGENQIKNVSQDRATPKVPHPSGGLTDPAAEHECALTGNVNTWMLCDGRDSRDAITRTSTAI